MRLRLVPLALSLLLPTLVRADNAVYRKVAPSTVWFFESGSASGVLVDAQNRLVLTAEHVVRNAIQRGNNNVKVIFAQRDPQGNILTEKPYYGYERKRVLGIQGQVILSNRMKDMALVQLSQLPPGVQAISLAKTMPQPGDNVHVVGNSTHNNGGLFSYSIGKTRNSYFYDRFGAGDCFFALAHHAPTNRGDSGGPVVNDQGELIGIVSSGTTGSGSEQVIDHSVHIREIRNFLTQANLPIVRVFSFSGTANVANYKDHFFLPVQMNSQTQMILQGNGATDLDLIATNFDAKDPKSRTLVAQTGLTDKEQATIVPNYNGVLQVSVHNLIGKDGASPTKSNAYKLDVTCQKPVRGPITISRNLVANGNDFIRVEFQQGPGLVRVGLRGDGDTDLDLFVTDPTGKEIAKEVGTTDRESVQFPVNVAGTYAIRVMNNSPQQFNNYILTID